MTRSFFLGPFHRILGVLSPGGDEKRRSRAHRFVGFEELEGRALMATIDASGVTSSMAAGSATPAPTSTSASAPPVTVVGVQAVKNRNHRVTDLVVDFSGPLNAASADDVDAFRLAKANAEGSFTARNSTLRRLRSAVFNAANDTVTLTPRKAISLIKPVQLTIDGTSATGLLDSTGRLIDGSGDGAAGSNAIAVIRRSGIALNPPPPAASKVSHATRPVISAVGRVLHSAPPTGSATPITSPMAGTAAVTSPVGISPLPVGTPVATGATPAASTFGTQPFAFAADALMAQGESMM
jgi:hypothetical protein